jgi:hypothetical protein
VNIGGWIMLVVSWGAIIWLTAFALRRTLKAKPRELAAPLDIETEIEEADARREKQREQG